MKDGNEKTNSSSIFLKIRKMVKGDKTIKRSSSFEELEYLSKF